MFRKGKIGWLLLNIFEAVLLIVAGVLAMAYCRNPSFQNAIILVIGVIVIVDAVLRIALDVVSVINIGDVTLIKTTYGQAITGALEMACGVLLAVIGSDLEQVTIVFRFIGIFIGTLVAISGLIAIVYAVVYLIKKAGVTWKNIVLIVIGVLLIAGGITAAIASAIAGKENIRAIFLVLFGIILMLAGAVVLYLSIAYFVEIKRAEKAEAAVNDKMAAEAVAVVEETPSSTEIEEEPAKEKPEETQPTSEENQTEDMKPESEAKPDGEVDSKPNENE